MNPAVAGDASPSVDEDPGVPPGLAAELLALAPMPIAPRSRGSTWVRREKSSFDITDQYGDD